MIVRRLKDVEVMDVGKAFGLPEDVMLIQWIISNEVGDERYHHSYAVRKYTIQPGLPIEKIPFHNHKYVQSPHILSGRVICENDKGRNWKQDQGIQYIFMKMNLTESVLWAMSLRKFFV